jgi:Leucine-rich repeat (LRR) protein
MYCSTSIENIILLKTPIHDIGILAKCQKLKKLSLCWVEVVYIYPLTYCENIEELVLRCCATDISPIADFKKLRSVVVDGRLNGLIINRLDILSRIPTLESIEISNTSIQGCINNSFILGIKNLRSLRLRSVRDLVISDFSFLAKLEKIEELSLGDIHIENGNSINDFINCENIKNIDISLHNINDFSFLARCRKLGSAEIHGEFSDLSLLLNSKKTIKELNFMNCQITNIECIRHFRDLVCLNLWGNPVKNFKPIENCKNIEHLLLNRCHNLSEISFITELKNLVSLRISSTNTCDISSIMYCEKLECLHISNTYVSDLSPVTRCLKIESLDITHILASNIFVIEKCKNIISLGINYSKIIGNIHILAKLKKLELLILRDEQIVYEDIHALKENLPGVFIDWN